MLNESLDSLTPARQTAHTIDSITHGQSVAQHFADALQARYQQLQQLAIKKQV